MCFSQEASIQSFLCGIISSILCIALNKPTDKIIGYLFGFVSLMQGIEWLLWKHQKCDSYNKDLSKLGMIFNHLQPIMFGVIILLINKNVDKEKIIGIICLYLCIIVPYSIKFLKDEKTHCTIKNENTNHLLWHWNSMNDNTMAYSVFLVTFCYISLVGIPKFENGVIFAIIIAMSFYSSSIFYNHQNVGALWCYYAAYFPLIYFIMRKSGVEIHD